MRQGALGRCRLRRGLVPGERQAGLEPDAPAQHARLAVQLGEVALLFHPPSFTASTA